MDRQRRPTVHSQLPRHLIAPAFRLHEYQQPASIHYLFQQLDQPETHTTTTPQQNRLPHALCSKHLNQTTSNPPPPRQQPTTHISTVIPLPSPPQPALHSVNVLGILFVFRHHLHNLVYRMVGFQIRRTNRHLQCKSPHPAQPHHNMHRFYQHSPTYMLLIPTHTLSIRIPTPLPHPSTCSTLHPLHSYPVSTCASRSQDALITCQYLSVHRIRLAKSQRPTLPRALKPTSPHPTARPRTRAMTTTTQRAPQPNSLAALFNRCQPTLARTHTHLRYNLPNLRFKPHVQHSIGLVQHQVRHSPQIRVSTFQHVNQTTRCCNHNLNPCTTHALHVTHAHALNCRKSPIRPRTAYPTCTQLIPTFLQVADLWPFRGTSVYARVLDLRRRPKFRRLLLNLHRQLTTHNLLHFPNTQPPQRDQRHKPNATTNRTDPDQSHSVHHKPSPVMFSSRLLHDRFLRTPHLPNVPSLASPHIPRIVHDVAYAGR
uniref:Uncharacterized protein n=1 Tax=Physcomitrium patens TaxID=3218 RepID=A0A2K1L9I1_PHYPA|nr:hypothetical protein PHYPA_001122 [Physcomitrium patens]